MTTLARAQVTTPTATESYAMGMANAMMWAAARTLAAGWKTSDAGAIK